MGKDIMKFGIQLVKSAWEQVETCHQEEELIFLLHVQDVEEQGNIFKMKKEYVILVLVKAISKVLFINFY